MTISDDIFNKLDEWKEPPQTLYKYLSPGRIPSALEDCSVRFTPLTGTNDAFEVRRTFNKIAGPKFLAVMQEELDRKSIEALILELIDNKLKDAGLHWLNAKTVLAMIKAETGIDFVEYMRVSLPQFFEGEFASLVNRQEFIDIVIEKTGTEILCFSLSERMNSAPMWAHYARENSGFLIGFDSTHEWFRTRRNGKNNRIRQVRYIDGVAGDEMLDDVLAVLSSKLTDWKYEAEWRLFLRPSEVDQIVQTPTGPVHLVHFPTDAVTKIVLGAKTSEEDQRRIAAIAKQNFPHVTVTKLQVNKRDHSYDEISIEN